MIDVVYNEYYVAIYIRVTWYITTMILAQDTEMQRNPCYCTTSQQPLTCILRLVQIFKDMLRVNY